MRVAVLGAGLSGTLVALELAEAGHHVSLFDRRDIPFAGASLACEGKIHLGFVYALDGTLRTARAMQAGASTFRRLIARWTGPALFDRALSGPFLYAMPRDSLLPADAIRAHFHAVTDASRSVMGPATTPECDASWQELPPGQYDQLFDPERIRAVFRTQERAIDTAELARALRDALAGSPRITPRMGCQITAVAQRDACFAVHGTCEKETFAEPFDIVVNALWEHRLLIDSTLGLTTPRDVMHRFKCGLFTRAAQVLDRVPNVTFLIGAFGDTVTFPGTAYLSWYPAGLVSQETGLQPRAQDPDLPPDQARRIVTGTLDHLRALLPGVADALTDDPALWTLKGGWITAWGRSGIDDAASELHQRHDLGVFSTGNYHSVETGKLTTAPLFAARACARILERHGTPR
jgi:hypothetical protein